MNGRTAVVVEELPDLAAEPDGTVWNVIYDGAPACDTPQPEHPTICRCRLPVGHDGKHMWFSNQLVTQTGVRFT